MKLLSFISIAILIIAFSSCKKSDSPGTDVNYPADLANDWMQLQIKLTKTTTGYNSIVSDRSFGYAGITLYEAIQPGVRNSRSLLAQIGGTQMSPDKNSSQYFWPASVNAAMAMITRSFFESTSAANKVTIDSLEAAYTQKFQSQSDASKIQNAVDYGHKIAGAIFEWSKTDGGHEAYKHITDPTYVPPVGKGLWVPTFPAFGAPVHPHWGTNRSFIPNVADLTQPGAPIPYDETPKSPFYEMVNELYNISLSLSHEDSIIAKFWGDQPGNLNVPAHSTNIVSQLIVSNKLDLSEAAAVYALHGVAISDASISVFKTKYQYNQLRPITYIRDVMKKSTWNSVIPTPPHPEYAAAHSVLSAASATVLENIFGGNYKFTDHTYDDLYGARSYNSFEDYAKEAGRARLLAGIHYSPSIATGLAQGNKVGALVNKLKLK